MNLPDVTDFDWEGQIGSESGEGLSPAARIAVIQKAVSEGMEVVISDRRTLLLDLDDEAAKARYRQFLPRFEELFPIEKKEAWKSKSGAGMHVKLTLYQDAPVEARLAMQAALGSDPMREMLGLKRVWNGIEEPSLLFKPARKPA